MACRSSKYKINCSRITGKLVEEVPQSHGGRNSTCCFICSEGISSIVYIVSEVGSSILRFRML